MTTPKPNGGDHARPIDDEPTMLDRWAADEQDPGFLAPTPPNATPAEKLRLRFPVVPPAEGTQAREEWDALGIAEVGNE